MSESIIGLLAKGLVIGFSIAAPVGPIGVLCIRRTLAEGRFIGLVSGLGAASADGIYGLIAAFGLTFISDLLLDQKTLLSLVGGAFLIYLGAKTLLARPAEEEAEVTASRAGSLGAYASTFFLTLTNPMTVLMFIGVFAGMGVANTNSGGYLPATLLVIGVFSGSALWWLTLSGGVSLFRERFDQRALLWVNRLSGAIIVTFGIIALIGSLR